MSAKVENGTLVLRTRARKGGKGRDQSSQALAEFLWRIDKPVE